MPKAAAPREPAEIVLPAPGSVPLPKPAAELSAVEPPFYPAPPPDNGTAHSEFSLRPGVDLGYSPIAPVPPAPLTERREPVLPGLDWLRPEQHQDLAPREPLPGLTIAPRWPEKIDAPQPPAPAINEAPAHHNLFPPKPLPAARFAAPVATDELPPQPESDLALDDLIDAIEQDVIRPPSDAQAGEPSVAAAVAGSSTASPPEPDRSSRPYLDFQTPALPDLAPITPPPSLAEALEVRPPDVSEQHAPFLRPSDDSPPPRVFPSLIPPEAPSGPKPSASANFIPVPAPVPAPVSDTALKPADVPAETAKPQPRTWGSIARRVVYYSVLAFGCWLVAVIALVVAYRFIDPPFSALMVQQRIYGQEIDNEWVNIDYMSPSVVRAVLLSEDGRFCDHFGVDYEAIQQAIERAKNGTPRGASTISMQVVKNLFLWPSKSYVRKAIELPLTYFMELVWSKRRIMEIYLNIAEWGPGVFGIESASHYHFGKSSSQLTEREAARLAVVLPNPFKRVASNPGPGTQRLANAVIVRMRVAPRSQTACVIPRQTATLQPQGVKQPAKQQKPSKKGQGSPEAGSWAPKTVRD